MGDKSLVGEKKNEDLLTIPFGKCVSFYCFSMIMQMFRFLFTFCYAFVAGVCSKQISFLFEKLQSSVSCLSNEHTLKLVFLKFRILVHLLTHLD